MTKRYYLLDSKIIKTNFKEKKPINMGDVDEDKFLDCRESPFTEIAYSQYGVSDDITKVLYSKMPISMEVETDEVLSSLKYITENLVDIYKIVNVKKENLTGMIYYIISVDEVN